MTMRKNMNQEHIEGYVYQHNLEVKTSGENSKNPGTVFIMGDLDVVVNENVDDMNIVTVHFTYVTETFAKSGKKNNTFTVLKQIIESENQTWLTGGKDNALKVKIDTSLELNDFVASDGQMVAAKRNGGGFVSIVDKLADESERNTFTMDMVITRIAHVDENPDRKITDHTSVSGLVFNFRNDILPVEFAVRNEAGMKYFEDMEVSEANPVYTKVWGRINCNTVKDERVEEAAFGEASVTTYERKVREWLITGTAKVPYEYGEDNVLTEAELVKARQNREVHLAEVKQRNEEYLASRNGGAAKAPAQTTAAAAAKSGGFTF